jgi:DNA-binding transcriptional LysR family regulator
MNRLIDSRQLNAFVALAKRGSFTLAGEELNLTQSAVSHAIKILENDVGCRLVDRDGRRVQLTEAGDRFLMHAENILREMEAMRSDTDSHSTHGRTRLRLGASTTACHLILPTVVREFRARFPRCSVRIEPGDYGRQIEMLRAGQVDLAIGLELPSPSGEDLIFTPLFDDELRFFVAPTHPWTKLSSIPREAISKETLILYSRTSYTYRLMIDYFREEKVLLNNFVELGSMEAIKEMAKLEQGAAVISPWIAREEVRAGSLVSLPLGRRKLRYRWAMAHWKGRRLSLAEECFLKICVSTAQSLRLGSAVA